MKFFSLLVFFLFYGVSNALCQYNAGGTQFYIGPTAGINIAKYSAGKNLIGVPSAHRIKPGYALGLMYKFKVNDHLSLHGEFSYVRKTRSVKDSIRTTQFKNNHIDAPILFELSFPAKNKYIGVFEYYFNVGPQLSYWLNGKGETSLNKPNNNITSSYDINFKQQNASSASDSELNRFQYGFILGSGLTIPAIGDNFFVFEMRYFFCQTYLGESYTSTVNDLTFEDDLRGNYQVFSLSFAYIFGLNFKPNSQKGAGTKVKTVVK